MKKDKNISRRDFIRVFGAGTAVTSLALAGCAPNKKGEGEDAPAADTPIQAGKMTMRHNPTSGDDVSLLGYGCMRWPKLPDNEDVLDQEEINRLVDEAIEYGVNYFDTSPAYCKGHSEEATGIALSRHPRDKYYIATKLSNFSPETWSREASLKMYHDSMKYLKTNYIDYLLLHGVGMGDDGMETLQARYLDNGVLDFLVAEREAGRIRNLGFSYHGDVKVFDWLLSQHDKYKWDFVQIQLNYLDWRHASEINPRNTNAEYLYGELEKRGIPAVIMEPLLGGRLSKVNDHVLQRLKEREPQRSAASWAFRYAGSHPGVLTVLSGMTCKEHLEDNLRSFCPLKPLSEEENEFLYKTADLMMQYPTVPCNECQYCMPCPYGLDIPGLFVHYNKCINEGNVPSGEQDEEWRRARRAYLVSLDRAIEPARQADHCVGCRQCVEHCPQGIDIPKELQRLDGVTERLRQSI